MNPYISTPTPSVLGFTRKESVLRATPIVPFRPHMLLLYGVKRRWRISVVVGNFLIEVNDANGVPVRVLNNRHLSVYPVVKPGEFVRLHFFDETNTVITDKRLDRIAAGFVGDCIR